MGEGPSSERSSGEPRTPLEALAVLAAQEVAVTPALRHLELFTMFGLLTLLPGLPFWESVANKHVAEALRGFAFNARFESIARGLIDLRDVLFYLTATAFFLVLNVAIVSWRRYSS